MDQHEWMNEQVRQEVEDLRRRFGFEEREAIAYWHLAKARALMVRLAIEENDALYASTEEIFADLPLVEKASRQMGATAARGAKTEAGISQHFSALYRELGRRVLSRDYPDGWTDTRI